MKFKDDYLKRYLRLAPAALAVERTLECEILDKQEFVGPILDIGCGDGIFADILFAGKIDTGIDPDERELARAAQLDAYKELIVCSGASVPKPDGSYATILSNSVLEHIPDLLPVITEAHRLLVPGGRFYVTIPTDRLEHNSAPARLLSLLGLKTAERRYGEFHNRFWNHFNVHTTSQWRALFENAGFQVVEERKYASPDFSSFYDMLVPLAVPSLLARKTIASWFFFPELRKKYSGAVHFMIRGTFRRLQKQDGSSLVFYSLRKV